MIAKNNLIPLAVLSSQFYKWSNKAGKDSFLDSCYLGKSGNMQFEARESFGESMLPTTLYYLSVVGI